MELVDCVLRTDGTGKELVQHGTVMFPVAGYYVNLSAEDVGWHWHDELEAVLVSEGEIISAGGARREPVQKGNGFFINTGVLHSEWRTGEEGTCHFHSLVFHPRLVGGSVDSIFWQNYLRPLLGNRAMDMVILNREFSWQREALTCIEQAWQALEYKKPGYEFMVRAALSRLIFLLYLHSEAPGKSVSDKAVRDGSRIKAMLQFIQAHYGEEITMGDISASALISESECLRCFKTTIGTTPIQYLRRFRLEQAASLLAETDEKISAIGGYCGFQEMSYFARAFRQLFGATPSEYRQERRKEA